MRLTLACHRGVLTGDGLTASILDVELGYAVLIPMSNWLAASTQEPLFTYLARRYNLTPITDWQGGTIDWWSSALWAGVGNLAFNAAMVLASLSLFGDPPWFNLVLMVPFGLMTATSLAVRYPRWNQ